MRTIAEIKKNITDEIIANGVLAEKLGLDSRKSWDAQVSSVSVINLLCFIVAASHYIMEQMFEQFKTDVESRIAAANPGSVSWLWNRAMEYQDDADANAYFATHGKYASIDEDKQIIKYAAVSEEYNVVTVKVAGANYDKITDVQREGFTAYMNNLKFAGVHLVVSSIDSDDLVLQVRVWRDRLIMPSENDNYIKAAVEEYLNGIKYGGVFNKTKLIDALQRVRGITDVTIENCVLYAHDSNETETDLSSSQNYKSIAGHINLSQLTVVYE